MYSSSTSAATAAGPLPSLAHLRQQSYFHQSAVKIDGIHTEILTCEYGDRIWIMISQTGKPGTVTRAESERPVLGSAIGTMGQHFADDAMLAAGVGRMQIGGGDGSSNNGDYGSSDEDEYGDGRLSAVEADMAIYEIETVFGKTRPHKDDGEDSFQIDLEQILSRQLLQLLATEEHMVRRVMHTKPILLFLGLEKSFEREILEKTDRGRDYLRLLVDFTKQTLLAGMA